jgi:hypothetical protein
MKDFTLYQEALALKELGFDKPCFAGYSTSTEQIEFYSRPLLTRDSFTIDAPTYSQAFRWFREKYDLCVIIDEHTRPQIKTKFVIGIGSTLLFEYTKNGKYAGFEYEEAELACLIKLINICKK